MSIEETSTWITGMFNHIPVQYYFAEIEESKHTNRKYRTEPIELIVDIDEISKREMSAEGHMTVSEYNKCKLLSKSSTSEIKQFMETDEIDITQNPTDILREKLHAKIEEVSKRGGNPQTKQKSGVLPESKKHLKRKDGQNQKDGKESEEKKEKKEKDGKDENGNKEEKLAQKKGNNGQNQKHGKDQKKGKEDGKMKKNQQKQKKGKEAIAPFVRPTMTSPELKDNLDFGTITFSNTGKMVPKYLTKKQKK